MVLPASGELFRFEHPSQQRIYGRLLKVGPGAARLFRDACRLMSLVAPLDTTTHVVAHLLRETESCLRDVLLPRDFERPTPCPSCGNRPGTHRKEIESIAEAWNLEDSTKEEWLRLAVGTERRTLHGYAHRRDLSEPRPLDEEFREVWYAMQRVLAAVLDRLEAGYLRYFPLLDDLLAKPVPCAADVTALKNHVPNSLVILGHFFDNLQNPAWLGLLEAKGFFNNPPEPEYDDERATINYPRWPQAGYLARMSVMDEARATVANIILRIPETDNILVHRALVDAMLAMPAHMAVGWVRRETDWVNRHEAIIPPLPEKLGELISHLARGGVADLALELARCMLAVLPPKSEAGDGHGGRRSELRTRSSVYEYTAILRQTLPPLLAAAGITTLELLCDLLDGAVALSPVATAGEGPEDRSGFWRPAVEDHEQNQLRTLESVLVSAVRDASEALHAEGRTVLDILQRQRFKVFWRISVHLRRKWPAVDPEGTAAMVTAPGWFDDADLHHELFLLLREQFGSLPLDVKNAYLAMVAQCTPHKQYEKLWPIQGFLDGAWLEHFNSLRERFGDLAHPDLKYYMTALFAGPASPYEADQVRLMGIDDLVSFLASWEPSGDSMAPSPEGLGRILTGVVAVDPGRFAAGARRFQGLDPTYVRALVTGLQKAVQAGLGFDWAPVLDLCAWVMDQPREIRGRAGGHGDRDPGWAWTRKAVASLLGAGVQEGLAQLPFSMRPRLWAILSALCGDPEPTPEYEQEYGGANMDPATLSINTVRGEAMHAVVRYALWVRRHTSPADTENSLRSLEDMPEVWKTLEDHLDPEFDPSPAVRSVYGRWLRALAFLDSRWVAQHVKAIFPHDGPVRQLGDAAWLAYVTYCEPRASVVEILRDEYAYAVEQIGAGRRTLGSAAGVHEHLAQHLMILCWRGALGLETSDGLLPRFFATAPDPLRGYALQFVGWALGRTTETVPPEILGRIQILWDWRLSEAGTSAAPESRVAELSAFGSWFVSGKFDDAWSIIQLKSGLRLAHRAEPDVQVVERLALLAPAMPAETVDCLRLLIEGDSEGWGILRWDKHLRAIIRTAIEGADAAARQAAVELIHRLGFKGYPQFADMLPSQA